MKTKRILLLLFFVLPVLTFAGEIFGTITKNGKPFAKQLIQITTSNGTVIKSDSTDAFGYFNITVKQLGQFKLSAGGATAYVTSNNSPTGYNFILVQTHSKWQLIKK